MAEALDRTVALRGLSFHYRDWGGEGPPLLLLHGLASTCHIWDLTAPLLARRFRVLALDQRGHGESEQPDDGYDFETISADLDAFIAATGLRRPALVGHSWGGSVALHYAATRPHVLRALALVDGGFLELAARPGMTWERAERELAPPDFTGMTVQSLLALAPSFGLGRVWGPEVEPIVLANFHIGQDGSVRPRLSRQNHMRILRALWELRASQLYPRIACPTLLVAAEPPSTDERSAAFLLAKREGVAAAQRLLPRCRVLWLEDTIHDVPLQRPRELAEAIAEFLAAEAP